MEERSKFLLQVKCAKFDMKKINYSEVIMRQLHKFHLYLLATLLG
jgi:hypothetical protein